MNIPIHTILLYSSFSSLGLQHSCFLNNAFNHEVSAIINHAVVFLLLIMEQRYPILSVVSSREDFWLEVEQSTVARDTPI